MSSTQSNVNEELKLDSAFFPQIQETDKEATQQDVVINVDENLDSVFQPTGDPEIDENFGSDSEVKIKL